MWLLLALLPVVVVTQDVIYEDRHNHSESLQSNNVVFFCCNWLLIEPHADETLLYMHCMCSWHKGNNRNTSQPLTTHDGETENYFHSLLRTRTSSRPHSSHPVLMLPCCCRSCRFSAWCVAPLRLSVPGSVVSSHQKSSGSYCTVQPLQPLTRGVLPVWEETGSIMYRFPEFRRNVWNWLEMENKQNEKQNDHRHNIITTTQTV